MMRKRAFSFKKQHNKRQQGLPLNNPQIERLLARLRQHTSAELGRRAGVHGATILSAAKGASVTHETARKILNLLDRLDQEQVKAAKQCERNLRVAQMLLKHEEMTDEGLAHLDALAADAAYHASRSHVDAYRDAVVALRAQIDRLKQC